MSWREYFRTLVVHNMIESAKADSTVPKQSASALPRNLKRLREAKGWSVARLARESVVHGSTIMSIEVGDMAGSQQFHDPQLRTCLKLAYALNVGIEELVEEREP